MCLVNGYNAAFIRKRFREGKETIGDLEDKEEKVLLCFHYTLGTLDIQQKEIPEWTLYSYIWSWYEIKTVFYKFDFCGWDMKKDG